MGDNAVAVGKFATDCAVDKTADCTANILVSVDGTCILHFAVVGDSAEDNTDDTTNKFLVCRVSLIIFFISTIESIFLYEIAIFIFQVIFFQAHLAVVDEGCIFADVDFTSCSIVAEDTANAVNCFIAFSGNTCCADCAFVDDVAIFTKDFTCVVAEESADVSQTINAWTEFNVGKVAVFAVDCALVFVCAHMEFTTKVVCADEATDILFCNDATCTVIREFKFILIGETVAIGIVFCRIPFNFACVDKWRACDIGVTVVEADEATNVGWNVCCQRRCNCKRAVQANALWNACETADVFWVCATCCVDCAVHFNEALFHTSTCAHIADHTTYVLDAIVSTQVDCAVEFHITTEGDEAVRAVIDVTCNTTDWGEISALRIVGCRCLFNENVTIDVAVLKWCGHFCTCCCVCYNSAEIIISADYDVCCGRGFLWGVTHLTIADAECPAWSLNADDTAYAVVVSSAEGCLLYVATSYVNKWWNVCALDIGNYATNCALVAVDSCVGNHWVCNGETIAWCTTIRHTNDATCITYTSACCANIECSTACASLQSWDLWIAQSLCHHARICRIWWVEVACWNIACDSDVFNLCISDNAKQTSINVGLVSNIIYVESPDFSIASVTESTGNVSAEITIIGFAAWRDIAISEVTDGIEMLLIWICHSKFWQLHSWCWCDLNLEVSILSGIWQRSTHIGLIACGPCSTIVGQQGPVAVVIWTINDKLLGVSASVARRVVCGSPKIAIYICWWIKSKCKLSILNAFVILCWCRSIKQIRNCFTTVSDVCRRQSMRSNGVSISPGCVRC